MGYVSELFSRQGPYLVPIGLLLTHRVLKMGERCKEGVKV